MLSPQRLFAVVAAGLGWRLRNWLGQRRGRRHAKDRKRELRRLSASPDFFPMKIDVQRGELHFVEMSRESFRKSAFLDHRTVRSGPRTLSAGLVQLKSSAVPAGRPLHFILHGAFCGSTLLARYLEELPRCLVLKEPGVLGQLARLKNNPGGPKPDLWDDWLRVTMGLASRAYASDSAVIIKAPDLCNWMGGHLLEHDARTKIVFLSSPLKVFLLQVLKVDHRRKWVREHLPHQRHALSQVPFLSGISAAELSDGQCAAAMWLLNSFLCGELLAKPGADRVMLVNGEELIARPQHFVGAAVDFFGLAGDGEIRAALEQFRPSAQHSKFQHLPYDAAVRASELGEAQVRCAEEIQAAMSWARQASAGWLSRSPFPVE